MRIGERYNAQLLWLALVTVVPTTAQVPFPGQLVQDQNWTSGVHQVAGPIGIISPGDPAKPMEISGNAYSEFVSATDVRLTDGFHAGGFSNGYFRAWIDPGMGAPHDLVIITPDPKTHIVNGQVHVNKWEKLEIGLRLPQDYQDAIARFFANYYPNAPQDHTADPSNTDPAHDLNPYADDSLQLVMTLTRPDGTQTLKWGFFMREATWTSSTDPFALLTEDPADPHHPYHIRFRVAPDEEGLWQFALSVKAPHTSTPLNDPLPDLHFPGYTFLCDPPLPDNHGYLQVNQANRRTLKFEDGTSFFGLGTNMADTRRNVGNWFSYFQRDFEVMSRSMQQLRSVGGNFMRMYLLRNIFAPEWQNLGVYDRYYAPDPCGSVTDYVSSCQWQCWAFDQMLDTARLNNIYIQLCIDPYPPIIDYQYLWGNHAYVVNYLEPQRDTVTQLFDMKKFFYADGDTAKVDSGVFYYWKRKYKYMMARWGWSVNLAAIEPFNEIDQMLTYRDRDLSVPPYPSVCPINRLHWQTDPDLPIVLNKWLTDLTRFVRGPVDYADPADSPLGETNKLWLMSYTNAEGAGTNIPNHFLPFKNDSIDLIDVHMGFYPDTSQQDIPGSTMQAGFDHANEFYTAFPYPGAPANERKPFNQGEFNHYTFIRFGIGANNNFEIEKYFHNYDVSFHNEIWSSAFSGKFAAGTSWHWERVFWWKDALKRPPSDPISNNWQFGLFSNVLGGVNKLDINLGFPILDTNKTLHHHFKPLSDLLTHPSWAAYDFFNRNYTANKAFSSGGEVESYYLKNDSNTVAIGWVHNRNAWVMNHYYLTNSDSTQNLLGCTEPSDPSITLTGFLPGTDYHISWFPTWMNSTIHPVDTVWTTSGTGTLLLDLATAPFGDTIEYYLDSLRADYAFIITLNPFVKSLMFTQDDEVPPVEKGWDFTLFPNPTRDALYLSFTDDMPKNIVLMDVAGRRLLQQAGVTTPVHQIPIDHLAKGAYCARVADGVKWKVKKFIIH